jgi:hypothetical protein
MKSNKLKSKRRGGMIEMGIIGNTNYLWHFDNKNDFRLVLERQ